MVKKEKSLNRTRIDGPIVNLCVARGLSEDQATDLIGAVSRIHLAENLSRQQKVSKMIGTNLCQKISIQHIDVDSPDYHRARRRIVAMEKAITRLKHEGEHGLRRKKWRKDKADARTIMDTLVHVLSRPSPQVETDMIMDARSLPVRTRELEDYRYLRCAPPTYQGKAGLAVNATAREVKLARSETDQIVLHDSPCGQLRIQMKNEVPDAFKHKLFSLCEAGAPAIDAIGWDGLDGPLKATLQTAREAPYYEESKCIGNRLEIIINTGWLERDDDTGILYPHPPGRTRMMAMA